MIGETLGPYRILEKLGEGGMGEVYRASDTKLGRDVAIKVLPHSVAQDADRLMRFEREARLLATLNHPHIGAIYGLEESGGIRALVLELVEGSTLADRLAVRSLPVPDALEIAQQIADALETAHEKGIVHRDLKPGNIMVTPHGVAKVLDFGLAKAFASDSADVDRFELRTVTAVGTRAGLMLGTPAYMSPEQTRGQDVDTRSDIWAFGCILYEMLVGRPAFGGETVSDTIAAILGREPDWNALPEQTPLAIRHLLRRCLRKDRKGRLSDASVVRIEIEEAQGESPLAKVGESRVSRRHERLAWMTALAVIGLVAAAAVVWMPRPESPAATTKSARFTVPVPQPIDFADWLELAAAPDGRSVVFVGARQNVNVIWLRTLDGGSIQELKGTENAQSPFWSPDGRYIGFSANGKLWKTTPTGGTVELLCDSCNAMHATWTPGNEILFADDRFVGISRVSATGGQPTLIVKMTPKHGALWPHALPDGRHFLYFDHQAHVGYVASLDGQTKHSLMQVSSRVEYVDPGYVLYARDGTLLAQRFDMETLETRDDAIPLTDYLEHFGALGTAQFSASPAGLLAFRSGQSLSRLTWLDRTGLELDGVDPPQPFDHVNLSPDGSKVVADIWDAQRGGWRVWVYDLRRRIGERWRTTPQSNQSEQHPVWSPDGRRVVYGWDKDAPPTLFLRPAVGADPGEPILPWSFEGIRFPWSWSRDESIVYTQGAEGRGSSVWRLPLRGDRQPIQLLGSEDSPTEPAVSPDARWLAFVSGRSGQQEIYVQEFPQARAQRRISTGGGRRPRWVREASDLVLYYRSSTHLMSIRIGRGDERPVPVFRFPPGMVDYDVADGGKRFLVTVPVSSAGDLPFTLIVNWTEFLKTSVR